MFNFPLFSRKWYFSPKESVSGALIYQRAQKELPRVKLGATCLSYAFDLSVAAGDPQQDASIYRARFQHHCLQQNGCQIPITVVGTFGAY